MTKKNNKNNNLFAFIRPSSYPIPPIRRKMEVAKDLGFDVKFIGARRKRNLLKNEVWQGFNIERLGIYYPGSSWYYLIGTPIFGIITAIWLIKNKPAIIHASDLEGIFGVKLYYILGGRSYIIYNIYDNYSLRYKVPKWMKNILNKIESGFGKCSDVVIVPDQTRLKLLLPWVPNQSVIIPNSTKDPGYKPLKINSKIKIFASGWLVEQRGYKILGELIKKNDKVELLICGEGTKNIKDYINTLPRTTFYGYLPQEEALKIGSNCDLIFAYYDPSFEINIYASPNKVYDALALGRPVVINEETEISKWVKINKVGYCLPYDNVDSLNQLINTIINDPTDAYRISINARKLYEKLYDWNVVKQEIIKIFNQAGIHHIS